MTDDLPAQPAHRPAAWLREQRGTFEGPQTLAPLFLLGPKRPGSLETGATYEPLYFHAAVAQRDEQIAALRAEVEALRADAERFDWLAERLQDVQIDGVDPTDHYAGEDDEPFPVLWRRAIDAARAEAKERSAE